MDCVDTSDIFNDVVALSTWLQVDGSVCDVAADSATDWPLVLRRAHHHGVEGILCLRLQEAGMMAELPADCAHALLEAHYRIKFKNSLLLRQAEILSTSLETIGIRPVLLKGAALLLTVYPDLALRPMRDVDLWVPPQHFREALSHLQQLGWMPIYPEQFRDAYLTATHHVALKTADPLDGIVELHHQWLSLPARRNSLAQADEIRDRAIEVPLGRTTVLVLAPEDQVLQLAAHQSNHGAGLARLMWALDVDQVIRRAGSDLDWAAVLERAQRYGMGLPLQTLLPELAGQFGATIPADVLAELIRLPVADWERAWYGPQAARRRNNLAAVWQRLRGIESGRARLHYARSAAWPSWRTMKTQHPDKGTLQLLARYLGRWAVPGRQAVARRRSQGFNTPPPGRDSARSMAPPGM